MALTGYVTGSRGENGPHIRIEPNILSNDRVGYRLVYTTSGLFGQLVSSRDDTGRPGEPGILQDRGKNNHMIELSFVAYTPALASGSADRNIIQVAEYSLEMRHSPNLNTIIMYNILSATPIPTGIADVSKTTLGRLKKKFPIAGLVYTAFSISYGSWSDYKTASETLKVGQEMLSVAELISVRQHFHLVATVTRDHSGYFSFETRITSDTLTVMDELNTVIKNYMEAGNMVQTEEGLVIPTSYSNLPNDIVFQNLSYPITISDFNTNLHSLWELRSNHTICSALE